MSVSYFFYWTEILFKEIWSPVLNVSIKISQSESGELELIQSHVQVIQFDEHDLDDSAVETPICVKCFSTYKKLVPKSSDFKEAGESLTLGNLFLADDVWLSWYNVVLGLTCAQMFC